MKKRRILITGAGSGIGFDIAVGLARRGHFVFATTFSSEQKKRVNKKIKELRLNQNMRADKLDINIKKDREFIKDRRINVLINNAGVGESGSLAEIDFDLVEENFKTNVFSAFRLTQNILPEMIKKKSGRIIFIGSLAGRLPISFLGSYCMTKFSIESGARALYKEMKLLDKNVHVSLVTPGAYATGFNQEMVKKKYKWMKRGTFFHKHIKKLKEDEIRSLEILEKHDTHSVVRKIVEAVESDKPKFRYSAPHFQGFLVLLLRIIGRG